MKSKPATYILLVAAIAIWGFIAWKIIDRPEPEIVQETTVPPAPVREKSERDSLWLNYRDPFLGDMQRAKADITPETIEVIPQPVPHFNVRYYGKIIKNRTANYIVEIDGQQYIMRHRDIEDGYRLQAVFDDSIRLSKEEHTFTVPLSL